MLDEYLTRGHLVFRGIVPPSLLADLRRQADIARDLAHELNGPQTQRIQPLDQYGDKIDLQPFHDYLLGTTGGVPGLWPAAALGRPEVLLTSIEDVKALLLDSPQGCDCWVYSSLTQQARRDGGRP